jgi:hypothetical protein
MATEPSSAADSAERTDDSDLPDDTSRWRRVHPNWLTREESGGYRPQSVAFVDRLTSEVSVFVAALTDADSVIAGHPDQSLVAFPAAIPRSVGGIIAKTPEGPNPAHRVLCYPSGGAMKRAAKKITEPGVFHWVRLVPLPTG